MPFLEEVKQAVAERVNELTPGSNPQTFNPAEFQKLLNKDIAAFKKFFRGNSFVFLGYIPRYKTGNFYTSLAKLLTKKVTVNNSIMLYFLVDDTVLMVEQRFRFFAGSSSLYAGVNIEYLFYVYVRTSSNSRNSSGIRRQLVMMADTDEYPEQHRRNIPHVQITKNALEDMERVFSFSNLSSNGEIMTAMRAGLIAGVAHAVIKLKRPEILDDRHNEAVVDEVSKKLNFTTI